MPASNIVSRIGSTISCKSVRAVLWFGGIGLLTAVFVVSPGCADLQSAQQFQTQAHRLSASLEAQARAKRQALEAMDPSDPLWPDAQLAFQSAQAQAQAARAGVEQLDKVLGEAMKPTDPLSQTIKAAGPLLPYPLRTPLLLGAAALVAGVRSWRLKAALVSVAKGFQTAMREDEEFQRCFAKHANTFRSTQTPTAKRIVDQTTKSAHALTLPI